MNESPNTMIEALKIVTEFLSNSSITIVLLVLLIICRDAISAAPGPSLKLTENWPSHWWSQIDKQSHQYNAA